MHYRNLALMTILSFISMYILMYLMVDNYANVYSNLNQFYMAGIMTMPMVVIELFFMGSMYPNKKINVIIMLTAFILFIVLVISLRKQVAIGDKEFLRSMIPHHAAALLMCNEARVQDPDIKQLCASITSSQQAEIDLMKKKLAAIS